MWSKHHFKGFLFLLVIYIFFWLFGTRSSFRRVHLWTHSSLWHCKYVLKTKNVLYFVARYSEGFWHLNNLNLPSQQKRNSPLAFSRAAQHIPTRKTRIHKHWANIIENISFSMKVLIAYSSRFFVGIAVFFANSDSKGYCHFWYSSKFSVWAYSLFSFCSSRPFFQLFW